MNAVEKEFRDRLYTLLGGYAPNDTSLNNFSVYLFRESISVLLESGCIAEVLKNHQGNSEMDKVSFMKAVKDLSVSCSQELVAQVFLASFQEYKNKIPMTTVVSNANVKPGFGKLKKSESDLNRNVGEFDIDITSIPKVEKPVKKVKPVEKKEQASNVFEGNLEIDLDDINQRTVRPVQKPVVNKKLNENKDEEFVTDASKFAEDYSEVPKVSVGLDY